MQMINSEADVELKRLERVLNSVAQTVCYLDTDLRFIYANKAYLRRFNCSLDEARGQHLSAVIGDIAFGHNLPNLKRALNGETVIFEAFLPCDDDKRRFVRGEMIPDRSEDGKVEGIIGIVTDLHERKCLEEALVEAMARLESLSLQDSLSGLGNHRAFMARLCEAERAFERDQTPTALLFFDVDNFKSFNDSFGHPAGDEVLRSVAALLCQDLRPDDIAARYGGEEFAVLLRGADELEAFQCAERLRIRIENHAWPMRAITVSGGIASFSPATPQGARVLELADKALYFAKACGKNRVCDGSPATSFV